MAQTVTYPISITKLADVNIRLATQADIAAIIHVARVTWEMTYNDTIDWRNRRDFLASTYRPETLAESVTSTGQWLYVAESADQVVGFGHFIRRYHPTQQRAELVNLYILPNHQRKGIGQAILETGFAALLEANITHCTASVKTTNLPARRFYERHGFVAHRQHGQFLGTQIILMVEYLCLISETK